MPCFNKPAKLNRQEKKKEYCKKTQDQKNSTPATGDNAIEREKKKNNRKYFNCLKKSHYTRNCPKPAKN